MGPGVGGVRAAASCGGAAGLHGPLKSHPLSFSLPPVTSMWSSRRPTPVPRHMSCQVLCLPLPRGHFRGRKTVPGSLGNRGKASNGLCVLGPNPRGAWEGPTPHVPPSLVKDFFCSKGPDIVRGCKPWRLQLPCWELGSHTVWTAEEGGGLRGPRPRPGPQIRTWKVLEREWEEGVRAWTVLREDTGPMVINAKGRMACRPGRALGSTPGCLLLTLRLRAGPAGDGSWAGTQCPVTTHCSCAW